MPRGEVHGTRKQRKALSVGFLQDVLDTSIDLRQLAIRYRVSVETVARRVFALSRLGDTGLPPLHFMKTDASANVLVQARPRDYLDIFFPRSSLGGCSKWGSARAFLRPLEVTAQWSVFPTPNGANGGELFCVSIIETDEGSTEVSGPPRAYAITLGCRKQDAKKFFKYARGFKEAPVEVGKACAICPRVNCNVRAAPNPEIMSRASLPKEIRLARKVRSLAPISPTDIKRITLKIAATDKKIAASDKAAARKPDASV